ncbi:MAG: FG-GAP repeat domain-containing protein, partial [Planctomycetia bacterium]
GNGNGTFQSAANFSTGANPISVTLGDVNGDGRLDIVTANKAGNNASVLLGTGGSASKATFSPQQTFDLGALPLSVTLGDVNGDGRLDLMTANYSSKNASVLLGNGDG